jgi:hypothetical protein
MFVGGAEARRGQTSRLDDARRENAWVCQLDYLALVNISHGFHEEREVNYFLASLKASRSTLSWQLDS